MVFGAADKTSRRRRFEKEEEAATGLLQLCDYFLFCSKHHHIEDNPSTATTTTNNNKKSNNLRTLSEIMPMSSVEDCRIAKAKPSMRDMHGQSRGRRGGKKKSMRPEISAAQHLLQLYFENKFKTCDKDFGLAPKFKEEEEENYLKSRPMMGSIDKFKVEDEEADDHHDEEEESRSDVSYITDGCSDMETTLAEISAAQQIMQLSNSHQQATTTTTEEEEEENKSACSVVASTRKELEEENYCVVQRKRRKFRSLDELYEITQPLEDPPYPYFE